MFFIYLPLLCKKKKKALVVCLATCKLEIVREKIVQLEKSGNWQIYSEKCGQVREKDPLRLRQWSIVNCDGTVSAQHWFAHITMASFCLYVFTGWLLCRSVNVAALKDIFFEIGHNQ